MYNGGRTKECNYLGGYLLGIRIWRLGVKGHHLMHFAD